MRSVRTQLQSHSASKLLPAELSQAISNLDQKAASLDGSGGRAAARLGGGGENLATINSTLTSLLNAVDSSDVLPTTQQVAAANELQQTVERLLAQWSELKAKDVSAINEQLRRSGLPPIDLQAAPLARSTNGIEMDEE